VLIKIDIEELTLLLARYESNLLLGGEIFYCQRKIIKNIMNQLNDENLLIFKNYLPLLTKEVYK